LLQEAGITVSRRVKKVIPRQGTQSANTSFELRFNDEIFTYVTEKSEVLFKDWADLMKNNFERCFWVPENKS